VSPRCFNRKDIIIQDIKWLSEDADRNYFLFYIKKLWIFREKVVKNGIRDIVRCGSDKIYGHGLPRVNDSAKA
jgi:hypothetical protein